MKSSSFKPHSNINLQYSCLYSPPLYSNTCTKSGEQYPLKGVEERGKKGKQWDGKELRKKRSQKKSNCYKANRTRLKYDKHFWCFKTIYAIYTLRGKELQRH